MARPKPLLLRKWPNGRDVATGYTNMVSIVGYQLARNGVWIGPRVLDSPAQFASDIGSLLQLLLCPRVYTCRSQAVPLACCQARGFLPADVFHDSGE
ncbi:hypothetical protein JYU34_001637 [Plutella xylostella]|uniref:Uncharacterized protein n=1 Tax=Plutella xylostella TaxID=51655 RepID=A0ABQ7R4F0_PLUXY|nr:hypothetical protein JYU34_001637 [Plutella xylostella]